MKKRVLAAATLACAVPALASAWTLNTWVKSRGGVITVTRTATGAAVDQRSAQGSLFYNYTTSTGNANNGATVTITPDNNYSINNVYVNGVKTSYTAPIPVTAKGSVTATFLPNAVHINPTAGTGGRISPSSVPDVLYGQVLLRDMKFTITPNAGYTFDAANSVIPTGASLKYPTNLQGVPNGQVIVTVPKGYAFSAGDLNIQALFTAGTIASAGANQMIQLPAKATTVTLDGSGSNGATSYVWTQTAGSKVVLTPSTTNPAQATFPMPSAAGAYTFQLAINGVVTTPGQAGYAGLNTPLISSTTVTVVTSATAAAKNICTNCHSASNVATNIYSNWSSSIHSRSTHSICAGCHVGNDTGSHPGTVMVSTVDPVNFTTKIKNVNGTLAQGVVFCTYCHNGAHPIPHSTANLGSTCAGCHTGTNGTNGTGDAHSIQAYTTLSGLTTTLCIDCHQQDATSSPLVTAYTSSIHKKGEVFNGSGCANCHSGSHDPALHASTANVDASMFITKTATVQAGEGGTSTTLAQGVVFCTACHKGGYSIPHLYPNDAKGTLATDFYVTCAKCHTDATGATQGSGDAHSIQPLPGCVQCHSFAQANVAKGMVNDNNGVRKIVGAGGEFQQWSHHIVNDINNAVDPTDAQCVVCHLEGNLSADGKTASVNGAKHMADASIHLRDCNTNLGQSKSSNGEFTWDPANPNHTAMDQFCMSCHNNAGAATAPHPDATATPTGTAGSALNPFGDRIQNNYDGLSRGAVVAVYDQFDPGNTSHHAVRAPRYTAATAGTPGNLIPAFANISANNANAPGVYKAVGLRYANGQSFVGTMADTGKFITTYKPLVDLNNGNDGTQPASFAPLADNSQLHCGDCHTVGQWAARGTAAFRSYSAAFGAGVTKYYQQAIGAHGSGNEYMLRNNNGDNSLNPMALVCYNCHASSLYGSSSVPAVAFTISGISPSGAPIGGTVDPKVSWTLYNYTGARVNTYGINGQGYLLNNLMGTSSNTAHDGVAGSLAKAHCNDDMNNTAGLTGLARLNSGYGISYGSASAGIFYSYTSGKWGSKGGGNAFGIKCANCHNSGDGTNAGYGGIHGNAFRVGNTTTVQLNAAYTTYSSTTAGTGTGTTWATTTHQPYRFLPGLGNFRYNGGSDWTLSKTVSGRGGCYTLNGNGADAGPTKVKNASAGRFTGSKMIADDNGLLGTWGACTEHTNNNHIPSRNVLRPTTY